MWNWKRRSRICELALNRLIKRHWNPPILSRRSFFPELKVLNLHNFNTFAHSDHLNDYITLQQANRSISFVANTILQGMSLIDDFNEPSWLKTKWMMLYADVKLEKTQQNLRLGVESFDRTALKPTDTVEKVVLPGTEGKLSLYLNFKKQNTANKIHELRTIFGNHCPLRCWSISCATMATCCDIS